MKKQKQPKVKTVPQALKPLRHVVVSVNRALNEIEKLVPLGYTEENFCRLTKAVATVTQTLPLEEAKALEGLWRDSYTDSCDPVALMQIVNDVRGRF
jgi:hypothetical protein